MKKEFDFRSDPAHYTAKACILHCSDARLRNVFEAFIREGWLDPFDLVLVPGGAKVLASMGSFTDRDFIASQIETLVNLHGAKRVILVNHSDCGAYGGLKKFAGDTEKEKNFHEEELRRAVAYLKTVLPDDVIVESVFMDFTGWYSVA